MTIQLARPTVVVAFCSVLLTAAHIETQPPASQILANQAYVDCNSSQFDISARKAPESLGGAFKKTGSMIVPRSCYTAILMPDGRVLVSGGMYPIKNCLKSQEYYDPSTASFHPAESDMHWAWAGHIATLMKNGKVLFGTGRPGSTSNLYGAMEIYDLESKTSTPTGKMNATRIGLAQSLLLDNGKVMVIGGRETLPEIYDPETGRFRTSGHLDSIPFAGFTLTLLQNGKVLIAGGGDGGGGHCSSNLYDPDKDQFHVTYTGRIKNHSATLLQDGRVLLAGGRCDNSVLNAAFLYDPAKGKCQDTGNMAIGRERHSAVRLPSGKVLIVGGTDVKDSHVKSAEIYDPQTGTFSPAGDLLEVSGPEPHALLLNNGKALIIDQSSGKAELFEE